MDSNIILRPDEAIIVPRGDQKGDPYVLDLKKIMVAEVRAIEIESVTKAKAGELLRTFNEAWRDIKHQVAVQVKNKNDAEKYMNEVRARILLDKVPDVLKEKKIGTSADVREAIIQLDLDYQLALDRFNYITAVVSYLETKAVFFERSYQSTKKLTENSGFDYSASPHLSGGAMPVSKPKSYEDTVQVPSRGLTDDEYPGYRKF